ncbi:MAG: hypothetical protein V3S89_09535 [Desulfobacterales bacterium]
MADIQEQVSGDVSEQTMAAFTMMWDAFPSMVMLLKKDRTIVAANKMARDLGVKPGIKCYELSASTGIHQGCLGTPAVEEGVAKRLVSYIDAMKQVLDSYWVPVQGEKDLYIHFATDITEYAKPEMFPPEE